MTATKDELVGNIKEWISIDQEILLFQKELKQRKDRKKILTSKLVAIMKTNEIDCFDIANGRIVYSKTKIRAPLSNGQLKSALTTYYKDDVEKANNLTEFLLSSRVEKTRESIKMKIPKIK